jgi:hypothetical protein
MSNDPGQADQASEDVGVTPDPEAIAARADGRPPEEASSDNSMAQAQTILQESEDRMEVGATGSEPTERVAPPHNPGA